MNKKISLSILFVVCSLVSFADPAYKYKPRPSLINCSLEDSDGKLWFGTPDNGVYKCDPSKKEPDFENFRESDGLADNNILSMVQDQSGTIWFGTKSGLCKYNPKDSTTTKTVFTPVPILVSNSTYFNDSKETSEAQREIWSMIQDKSGRIWLGTNEGVFYFQSGQEQLFTHFLQYDYTDNPNNLQLNAVTSILEDKRGNIWFTTWFEGLCCYNGKAVTNYTPEGKVWFATVFEDKTGNLWVGSRDHGVYCYAPSADSIRSESFVNVFPDTDIFNACAVPAITQDEAGNMWFGTEFGDLSKRNNCGGLWCYNSSKRNKINTPRNFTTDNGLVSNSVFDLIVDRSGNLWIGTRRGLCNVKTSSAKKRKQHFIQYDF